MAMVPGQLLAGFLNRTRGFIGVGFQIFEKGGEYRQRYAIAFRDCQRGSQ